jgi:hypothetical protein
MLGQLQFLVNGYSKRCEALFQLHHDNSKTSTCTIRCSCMFHKPISTARHAVPCRWTADRTTRRADQAAAAARAAAEDRRRAAEAAAMRQQPAAALPRPHPQPFSVRLESVRVRFDDGAGEEATAAEAAITAQPAEGAAGAGLPEEGSGAAAAMSAPPNDAAAPAAAAAAGAGSDRPGAGLVVEVQGGGHVPAGELAAVEAVLRGGLVDELRRLRVQWDAQASRSARFAV